MSRTITRSPRQLGHAIQQIRREKGLTQTELGQLVGLRQEMVSKIESGQPGVKFATVCDLLTALGLEMTIGPRSKSSTADIEDAF